jgi:hypothetical protein
MNGLVMSDTTLVQQAKKASFLPPAKGVLQRKCACGNKTITSGECEACGTKRKNLQRREVDNRSEVSEIPSIVHDVLRSSGRPLDAETRAFMEPRLGHDFSGVRVHTDAKASESAQAVNALAYTVGRNVVFRTGQFTPESVAGKHLLAHELAHTIQQQLSSGYATSALMIAEPGSSLENEADRAADATVSQSVASVKASCRSRQWLVAAWIKKATGFVKGKTFPVLDRHPKYRLILARSRIKFEKRSILIRRPGKVLQTVVASLDLPQEVPPSSRVSVAREMRATKTAVPRLGSATKNRFLAAVI